MPANTLILPFATSIAGLFLLLWSADRFVDGTGATARYLKIPPLIIGMIVLGFGTSAPEMVVSAVASSQGNPGIALGNAYGSNITNIALVLGLTALISPIMVHSRILRQELPILTLITILTWAQLHDAYLSRWDAVVLLVVFSVLMGWTIWHGMRGKSDTLGDETDLEVRDLPLKKALFNLVGGLLLLSVASRTLVWGAVEIARGMGVSDLLIGLTIVALGTSLPELASSLAAIRKREHDLAVGNVIGSNLFNTLAVVGIAGIIHPFDVSYAVVHRDIPLMGALTISLFIIGFGIKRKGRINRWEGAGLLIVYIVYLVQLIHEVL